MRIQGPRAHDFFMAFAKGSATGIKANGEDILSVKVIVPPSPPPAANGEKEKKRPEIVNSRKARLSVFPLPCSQRPLYELRKRSHSGLNAV